MSENEKRFKCDLCLHRVFQTLSGLAHHAKEYHRLPVVLTPEPTPEPAESDAETTTEESAPNAA